MPKTLYWLQCGGCGGDTWSLMGHDAMDAWSLLKILDVDVLWHPSLSAQSHREHHRLRESLLAGDKPLDILCVEGSIIRGPGGTGMFDTFEGRPRKELVAGLARRAGAVIAVGTCASFGGIGAEGEVEAVGLQFLKASRGGFLGEEFRSATGSPVINLPGCPCHPEVIVGALTAVVKGYELPLNALQMPEEWYGMLVHSGCLRNEYHEYRVEEEDFGQRGCLFFHLGCHGPLARGPCNKFLWARRSSKTRVGVPCFGCTMPDFPQASAFFHTRNIAGIPLELPEGVDRAHYMAQKGMAAAAAPTRLVERKTRI